MSMTKREWKRRYKQRLIDRGGVDKKFAEQDYQGGIKDHDYEESPEDAADMSMSYWAG